MSDWQQALKAETTANYFQDLQRVIAEQRADAGTVYPPAAQVFAAFDATPLPSVKVLLLGQDPYHGVNQANGLCFSVTKAQPLPPSLRNIFKELQADTGCPPPAHGDLRPWAEQGVLLLNSVLTVRAGQAQSHQGLGWERFTDAVIRIVSAQREHCVFMLWGKPAQSKQALIDAGKHTILTSVHPSPLSAYRGFFGCRHFSKANAALVVHGQSTIQWDLSTNC